HICRTKFLWEGACYERLRIFNYGLSPIDMPLSLQFDADFADIFEVRGLRRELRGRRLEGIVEDGSIHLAYEGLDGVVRRTRLECCPRPTEASSSELRFDVRLPPKGELTFYVTVSCESAPGVVSHLPFDVAAAEAEHALKMARDEDCEIYTSNEQFNDWL